MLTAYEKALLEYLLTFATDRRRDRCMQVLRQRTRWITVVLEDVYASHNISAVLRSCDAFGIQDVHVIERFHMYRPNADIALGSEQWLSVYRYPAESPPEERCVARLRAAGYRLLAVTPHADAPSPEDIDITRPSALLFGSEKDGLSHELASQADDCLRIPMRGFVESLNISVAAAICLYSMSRRLRSSAVDWSLEPAARQEILLEWVRKFIPHAQHLEQRFRESWERDHSGPST